MKLLLFLVLILFAAVGVSAFDGKATCRISSNNWDLKDGQRTSTYVLATFPLRRIDEVSRITVSKEAAFEEFLIDAEVEFDGLYRAGKQSPKFLQLSLFAMRADDKISDKTAQTVTARIPYRKKWGTGSVNKVVVADGIAYSFTLTCSDGVSRPM